MDMPENIQSLLEARPNVAGVLMLLHLGVPAGMLEGMVPRPRDLQDDLNAMEDAGLIIRTYGDE